MPARAVAWGAAVVTARPRRGQRCWSERQRPRGSYLRLKSEPVPNENGG